MLFKSLIIFFFWFEFSEIIFAETFENVTVLLTTQRNKLFMYGQPPIAKILINSSEALQDFVNLQPFEVLTIRNENILELKENSVSDLPNIEHINIISSGLQEIKAGAFQNVPRLDGLNLESNNLEEIRNGVFTGLRIKSLYLNNNKISKIDSEAFNNMTMTLISLNHNRLTRWESNWFVGTPVGSIYISYNFLQEIPADAFDYGMKFKRINVPLTVWHFVASHNRIGRIHKDAFRHINAFSHLSFANNYLKDLPKDLFHSVKNINTLDLSNNRISDVHDVFNDINLHQLILINNTLSCFPTEAFDISRISFVFLDGNQLSCDCVKVWKKIQIQNNIWVVYNMGNLEKTCV